MAVAVFDLERAVRIVAAYSDGPETTTFGTVGAQFGISGERVRQVIERYEEVAGTKVPRRDRGSRQAPAAPPAPKPSVAQALLSRAKLTECGCWEWTGPTTPAGAPVFTRVKGQQHAHRAAFVLWCGPIPTRSYVAQTCRNRLCINPAHLVALPRKEAIRLHPNWDAEHDTWRTGRKSLTRCRNGHEFTAENTRWATHTTVEADGGRKVVKTRLCATCARERGRRYAETHPPPPHKPLPALPTDLRERELERQVRAIVRVSPAGSRAGRLWREVAARIGHIDVRDNGRPVHVRVGYPAAPDESWTAYTVRTQDRGEYEHWFVCRMLGDPRIQKLLGRARSTFIISDQWPGEREHRDDRAACRRVRRRPAQALAGRGRRGRDVHHHLRPLPPGGA